MARDGDEQPEISGHDVIDVIGDEDVGLVATPEARPEGRQDTREQTREFRERGEEIPRDVVR